MPWTKKQNDLRERAMIKRYGSIEAWRDQQRRWGAEGGKRRNSKKGFGSNRVLAILSGKKSKRGNKQNEH